jgi:predicted peroxiredoxin
MTEKKEHDLQVIITHGPEDIFHAVLGFAFAASAVTSDINVKVILILNGVVWLTDKEAAAHKKVKGFDSIKEYMNVLIEYDTDIYLCSACAKNCGLVGESTHNNSSKFPYIGLTEVAIFASRDSTQTVVF